MKLSRVQESKHNAIQKPSNKEKEIVNYRPISILNVVYKIFELIIYNRISTEVNILSCIPSRQILYRISCYFLPVHKKWL